MRRAATRSPPRGCAAPANTRSRAWSANTRNCSTSSPRSMTAPPLASDALAYEPLAWTGPADDVERDRWGWVEIFLAIQLLWGAALFLPGAQAYRAPVRALPYLTSAAALVYYFRTPTGEPLHGSIRWLMASFGLLTLNLLHATTHSMAGVAQIVFQISIAAPVFWMGRAVRTDRRVMRMVWLLFGASFL